MMIILSIDPGNFQSGWCVFHAERRAVLECGVDLNDVVLEMMTSSMADACAIEMISGMGMAVGKEVFDTCVFVGRLAQAWDMGTRDKPARLIYRKDVKLHICGSSRAKDPNIRQALIDMFPATGGGKVPQVGIKSAPGPLFGVSSHVWPALAVAIVAAA